VDEDTFEDLIHRLESALETAPPEFEEPPGYDEEYDLWADRIG
jgi:hypothetical protein